MNHLSSCLQILVVFCGQGVVKVNVIRIIATQIINKDTLSRLIIIVQNRVTNQALKAVDLFNFKVEIFQVSFTVLLSFSFFLSFFILVLMD